ncbi:MAG: response regulator, partial [Pseudomonadota bacterium]
MASQNFGDGANPRILLVESEEESVKRIRRVLANYQLDVEVLSKGSEVLPRVKNDPPALILLCAELPDGEGKGYYICNKLKKTAKLKDVPVIIMSSKGTKETFDLHRKLPTRAEDYVTKPVEEQALMTKISQLIDLQLADDTSEDSDSRTVVDGSRTMEQLGNVALDGFSPSREIEGAIERIGEQESDETRVTFTREIEEATDAAFAAIELEDQGSSAQETVVLSPAEAAQDPGLRSIGLPDLAPEVESVEVPVDEGALAPMEVETTVLSPESVIEETVSVGRKDEPVEAQERNVTFSRDR